MAQFINPRYEIFKSQDLQSGHFDLKFEVEGKTIYAHKFMLATVSDVLKAMVSDIWNTGEFIKVETYSYKDFYEFIEFIYSGECKINDENIFTMVDLSEFYQVKSLQQKCDKYLSRKKYTSKNVLVFLEALSNYSFPFFEEKISKLLKGKRINLVESEGFLELSKEMIQKIVSLSYLVVSEERLFEKVYECAENRALKKQEESINENFNKNDAIKTEITEFLPFFNFKNMTLSFLHEFVVARNFLFTNEELSEILEKAKSDKKVKVTNENGKSIFCMLSYYSDVIEHVKTLKSYPPANNTKEWVFWETQFTAPSYPSSLKKRKGIEWYLVYSCIGEIGVINHALLKINDHHYLIAEMTAETDSFEITQNCKIEIE